jgi:phosphoglucomutase
LIEEFMVAANAVAAIYLAGNKFPSLRRVLRDPERWARIVELAAELKEPLPAAPDAVALEGFLTHRRAAAPEKFADLSLSVIKLIGRGEYALDLPGGEAPGHFALAVKDYTHSTAPNRRFPDLITQRLAERHELGLTVVSKVVDPTFSFMTVDWDGQIRMDPSSTYAMQRLIGLKDKFDLSFACDTDHDRHGIVTKNDGLLPPNHDLCAAVFYLFANRPRWSPSAAVGKTIVSSQMIDRITTKLGRKLFEVPVGFKWFVAGLLDGSLGFAGEESAGSVFLRLDGTVWTTDKDGIVPCLLAVEMTARTGCDPANIYRTFKGEFGESFYERVDAPATPEQKKCLANLLPGQVTQTELAGEKILATLSRAPGNDAPIGGLKVIAKNGWFAARPSGTENIYKIYAESFQSADHLRRILAEAQTIVSEALGTEPTTDKFCAPLKPHELTIAEAVSVWRNEGDPN